MQYVVNNLYILVSYIIDRIISLIVELIFFCFFFKSEEILFKEAIP